MKIGELQFIFRDPEMMTVERCEIERNRPLDDGTNLHWLFVQNFEYEMRIISALQITSSEHHGREWLKTPKSNQALQRESAEIFVADITW